MKRIIFIIVFISIGTSCVEDVKEPLPYEEQYLIVGYSIKDVNGVKLERPMDFTFVQVYASSTAEKNEIKYVTNAVVVLKRKSSFDESSDTLKYFQNVPLEVEDHNYFSGYYLKKKIPFNEIYWLEVTIANETYVSNRYGLQPTNVGYIVPENLKKPIKDKSNFGVIVVDESLDVKSSFIADNAQYNYISLSKSVGNYKFFDKKYRNFNDLELDISLAGDGKDKYYILEIPEEVEYFFTSWATLYGTLYDDPASQLFTSPPSSLPSEFHDTQGVLADKKVKGLYFPANGLILPE